MSYPVRRLNCCAPFTPVLSGENQIRVREGDDEVVTRPEATVEVTAESDNRLWCRSRPTIESGENVGRVRREENRPFP